MSIKVAIPQSNKLVHMFLFCRYAFAVLAMVICLAGCSSALHNTGSVPVLAKASPPAGWVVAKAYAEEKWWQPKADQNLRWYWQLQGNIDTSYDVDVYDIDIDTPQPVINRLKARGIRLICYFSVGTVEQFRSDANRFPHQAIGETYPGYADERWLDLKNYSLFASIMQARLDRCAAKGFDGVEGDNVDAFLQQIPDDNGVVNTGTSFKITRQHSIDYILWLASESHKRGLAFGLKNSEAVAIDVVDDVDWLITESCYVYRWCAEAQVFTRHNKPVFMTEYTEYLSDFTSACAEARMFGYSAIYRDTGLTARGIFEECLLSY